MNVQKDIQINSERELKEVLGKITFKNSILDFHWRYCYKPFFEMKFPAGPGVGMVRGQAVQTGWLLWVEFERPDLNTGKMGWGRGRDEIVMEGSWESGLVKTAYVLYRFIVEHEMMEGFQYNGVRIFNPHHTVHELSLPDQMNKALGVSIETQTEFRNSVKPVTAG